MAALCARRTHRSPAALALLLCLALAPPAFAAEESNAATPSLATPEICAPAEADNPLKGAVELAAFTCQGSYTVSCSGTALTCAAATSAFTAKCQAAANAVCEPDPTCNFSTASSGCVAGGGSFTVSGTASFGCKMVW